MADPTFSSVSGRIKYQIIKKIEAGSSAAKVYGFDKLPVSQFPAVFVKVSGVDGDFWTNAENMRVYSYRVLILFQIGQTPTDVTNDRMQNAEDAVAQVVDEILNVIDSYRRLIADNVHQQMMAHAWAEAVTYEAKVSRGFTHIKPCSYTVGSDGVKNYRETVVDKAKIKQMIFGGFSKCLYQLQKFDSDTERRFAVLLERDSIKWLSPCRGSSRYITTQTVCRPSMFQILLQSCKTAS